MTGLLIDKDSPHTCSTGERQRSLNIGENSFTMEQGVESLVLVSNGYVYTFIGRELVKWKRMQKAKIVAIKRC